MKGSKGGYVHKGGSKNARAHTSQGQSGKPYTGKTKGAPKPGNVKENPAR